MTVSAVLVNYNDKEHIEACLDSLLPELTDPGDEVIVVDNASADGSRERVAERYPRVRLLANKKNLGFARANNRGIRESRGGYILILNTDTVIRPYAIRRLIETLESEPGAGACGPALVHPDGRFQVSFGHEVGFFGQLFQKGVLNPMWKRRLRHANKPHDTAWLSAACLLARREAIERVRGFDEGFFLYFEDIDLCRRLRDAGWRLIFDPRVQVQHAGGGTTAARPRRSRMEYRRGQLRFYDKHASPLSRGLLRTGLRLSLAWTAIRGGFRDEDGKSLRSGYRDILRGKARPE